MKRSPLLLLKRLTVLLVVTTVLGVIVAQILPYFIVDALMLELDGVTDPAAMQERIVAYYSRTQSNVSLIIFLLGSVASLLSYLAFVAIRRSSDQSLRSSAPAESTRAQARAYGEKRP
jgi:hypothetical protein